MSQRKTFDENYSEFSHKFMKTEKVDLGIRRQKLIEEDKKSDIEYYSERVNLFKSTPRKIRENPVKDNLEV